MALKVMIPGVLTTVQDKGRFGYQKSGMTSSGVMDACAYRKSNYLVGNLHNEAVLEMTLYGGEYEFTDEALIALTGADMAPMLNDRPIPMNHAIMVKAGDDLKLGMAQSGCRTYLAAAGGIDVPVVMNSRSTNLRCKVGGFHGRALQVNDVVPLGVWNKADKDVHGRSVSGQTYPDEITVHVVPGPQEEYFTASGIKTFYSERYKVTEECDRMGYRLEGAKIESKDGTDIVSDGIVYGSIQIPSSGKPIILMADHQTTGGYAKIGTVCQMDLSKLAQCRPGNYVRFERISVEKAEELEKEGKNYEL